MAQHRTNGESKNDATKNVSIGNRPVSGLKSGAESIFLTLASLHDHVVVCSETASKGIAIPRPSKGRTSYYDEPFEALSFAAGLASTGVAVGVFLDSSRLKGTRELILSSVARQLPMTVVLAQPLAALTDAVSAGAQSVHTVASDTGAPVLSATTARQTVDFVAVARALTDWIPSPIVILADGRDSVWSLQRVEDTPSVPEIATVPSTISNYRETLFGTGKRRNPEWLDTAAPMQLGAPMPDIPGIKQRVGRDAFLESAFSDLIQRAFDAFADQTGRSYTWGAVSSQPRSDVVLVAAGALAARLVAVVSSSGRTPSGVSAVGITQIHPFPSSQLADVFHGATRIGVLGAGRSGSALLGQLVQAVESATERILSRRSVEGGKRKTRQTAPAAPIVFPVICPDAWRPVAADLEAIADRLRGEAEKRTLVAGTSVGASAVRLPEIERIRQAMLGAGADLDAYEIDLPAGTRRPGGPQVFVVTGSSRETWRLMSGLSHMLDHTGARNVRALFHPSSDATTHPVIGLIEWDATEDYETFVLARGGELFGTLPIREILPESARVLLIGGPKSIPDTSAITRYPHWMASRRVTVAEIDAVELDVPAVPGDSVPYWALAAALVIRHPHFAKSDASILQQARLSGEAVPGDPEAILRVVGARLIDAPESAFETASGRPPEPEVPREVSASYGPRIPVSDLSRFWKTTGVLYREGKLQDVPADPFLTSGALPARSGSLTQQLQGIKPLPHVIVENCTGCGACWTMCPESAFTSSLFSIETLFDTAVEAATAHGKSFLQVTRLRPALVKTMHRLAASDDLHLIPIAAELLKEAARNVLEKAELDETKQAAAEEEIAAVARELDAIRPIRTARHFDGPESAKKGSGRFLGLTIDPFACTTCGLCISSCADGALERSDTAAVSQEVQTEWRRLTFLNVPPPLLPDESTTSSTRETAPLTMIGRSMDRVFRAGGADVGNVNRTALRLFLEAAQSVAHRRHADLIRDLEALVEGIDEKMQNEIRSVVSVNDFEAFSRSLKEFDGPLDRSALTDLVASTKEPTDTSVRDAKAAESLTGLADLRKRCTDWLGRLRAVDTSATSAHMVLVQAMSERSFGLAGYPINPFGMPCYVAHEESAGALVAGVYEGLRKAYRDLVLLMSNTERVLEGVYEPDGLTPEEEERLNRQVLRAMPSVLLATDRLDAGTLAILDRHPLAKVLLLSDGYAAAGGVTGSPAIDLALGMENAYVMQMALADPVTLLDALIRAHASDASALMHVYAPDPVRDGLPADEALSLARAAIESRVFPSLVRVPGRPVDLSGNPKAGASTPGPEDWMLAQERFAPYFEFVPRKRWSQDDLPIREWLKLPPAEQGSRGAYVERRRESGLTSRYLVASEVTDFARSVAADWKRFERMLGTERPTQASISDPLPPKSDSDAHSSQGGPEGFDVAFATLSEHLFEMSGFKDAHLTLGEWQGLPQKNGTVVDETEVDESA